MLRSYSSSVYKRKHAIELWQIKAYYKNGMYKLFKEKHYEEISRKQINKCQTYEKMNEFYSNPGQIVRHD